MKSIYLLQWRRFVRNPWPVLSMVGLTIAFVFVIAGMGTEQSWTVYTYAADSVSENEAAQWLDRLNEADDMHFEWIDEEEATEAVAARDMPIALKLLEDDYRVVTTVDDPTWYAVEQYIQRVYTEELRLRALEELNVSTDFRIRVEQYRENPPLALVASSVTGQDDAVADEERLQVLFGMTLYFAVFTALFSLGNVAAEKQFGTWDRLILSPLKKWHMYVGHILYCFTVAYAQIVCLFLFFHFVFNIELGDRFGTILVINAVYVFAIVAFAVLVIGLVRSTQQLQVVNPLVATSMAMLGGAFWPLEIVTNDMLLTISRFIPLTHAMNALKGASIYDWPIMDVAEPIAMMLLFGVLCMGIGINVMERRKV